MRIITINGIDYDIDTLADEVRGQIRSIQFIDDELEKLKSKISVMRTARMSYAATLQELLEDYNGSEAIESGGEDAIDLSQPL